jgi:Flp pilus assembly protein TadB
MNDLTPPVTHPETAWLALAVAPALTAAALLVAGLLLRGRLALLLAQLQARRAARRLPAGARPDPALVWAPETIAPERLAALCLAVATAVAVVLSLAVPPFLALLLGAPLTALGAWGLIGAAEQRYVARLDRDLTAAVGRLSALLKASAGLRPALERVVADMPEGPLRAEWALLIVRQGAPLAAGGIATAQQVIAAMAGQTPSRRHATLLNHLAAAAGQPQDVVARRCEAAYGALQASDRRRDEAVTELAQVRYSGVAVGLAGVGMAAYLAWSQWERVLLAYSSPLGSVVGLLVLVALTMPIAGGVLLARVDDTDY